MMLPPFALSGIALTLNRLLARDPAAPARLAPLEGSQIRLSLDAPAIEVQACVAEGRITIAQVDAHMPTPMVQVHLTPDAVGALLGGTPVSTLMFAGRLPVDGDTGCLMQWHRLLATMDVDGEGGLARVVGDIPAHLLMQAVRHSRRWGQHAARSLHQDGMEYITEEARLVAGRAQQTVLRDQLSQLSTSLDRVEARIGHLTRQLEKEPAL